MQPILKIALQSLAVSASALPFQLYPDILSSKPNLLSPLTQEDQAQITHLSKDLDSHIRERHPINRYMDRECFVQITYASTFFASKCLFPIMIS